MSKFNNSVAVITGAGGGIGKQLALELARLGANISISDIDNENLEQTAKEAATYGGRVHRCELDVSDRAAVFNYADLVDQEFGEINLIINNAGVGLASGGLRSTTVDEFEWLMSINFSGVLYGTKAFLPLLEKAQWGHIVNISSLFGLIGVAEQAAYNASKFAVRGMTEALRQELEMSGSHISCTSIHPGGIKTDIARNARVGANVDEETRLLIDQNSELFDRVARTTPESAAKQILNAVVKNQRRLLIGKDAKLMDWLQRHFPNHYQRVFHWVVNWLSRP